MNVFILIVVTALALKAFVLWLARQVPGETKVFLGLVLMFALHNTCELLIYLNVFQGYSADWLLRAYYVASALVVTWMCLYSMHVAGFTSKYARNVPLILGGAVSLIYLFSDLVLSGAESLGPGVTAIKGPFYLIFQITMFSGFLFVIMSLLWMRKTTDSYLTKTRCTLILLALLPVIIAAMSVIVLMQLNVKVNAAGLIPISTSIFLILVLRMERSHKLTDVRMLIPGSEENRVLGELMEAFSNYSIHGGHHKDTLNEIERALVMYKHVSMSDKPTAEIAAAMGMPRPTLYSIYNRLGIRESIKRICK